MRVESSWKERGKDGLPLWMSDKELEVSNLKVEVGIINCRFSGSVMFLSDLDFV